MATRKTPTERFLAALPRADKRATHRDPALRGGHVRLPEIGSDSPAVYTVAANAPSGKKVWHKIGNLDVITIEAARDRARPIIDRIRQGLPPKAEAALTFEALSRKRQKLHVERLGLRTENAIIQRQEKYTFPRLGHLPVDAIRKSLLSDWADDIVEAHGPRMADLCMADVIATLNWHAGRSDDYVAPARLPRRVDHAERPGRALTANDIRVIWKASEDGGQMGAIVRVLLLTTQRLQKVLTMKWADIDDAGLWTLATEPREKNNAGTVRLPSLALNMIRSQPAVVGCPYVFAGARGGYFTAVAYSRLAFDRRCAEFNDGKSLDRWVLHDLRRTGRTILSELGVSDEVAEAVLGHVRTGVRGIYNRAMLDKPKADALAKLAGHIEALVDPDRGRVIAFPKSAV